MKQDIQSIIKNISDVLLMNGGFLSNPGLYAGETGLVLFFAYYARYTQNDIYREYAYDLMGRLQNKIYRDIPISYKHGLTGIGSAIEYLVQNGFFESDTDEILEDFDQRIFFTYNLPCLLLDEIVDIGYYASWRISGNSRHKDMIRQTVLPQIEKILPTHSVIPAWNQPCKKNKPDGFADKTYSRCVDLIANHNFWNQEMGFHDGLAGWGLSLLTEFNEDNSWFSLFPNNFTTIQK